MQHCGMPRSELAPGKGQSLPARSGNMPDRYLYDHVSTSEGGINSLLSPLLLPKNTLAWAINATIRGGYIQPRPPLLKQTITYPSSAVQTAVESGYFQGAGYYRPDFGSQQLVAQISGRIFTFTPQSADTWACVEITIAGDPNSATATQAWMNQAEKWLIITDGSSKLPLFWDGTALRRSYGPSVVLATVTTVDLPGPNEIGTLVAATLTAPWTGPFNVPVLFNGEFYQTIQNSGTTVEYTVKLTNIHAPAATNVSIGAQIILRNDVYGYSTATNVFYAISGPLFPSGWAFIFTADLALGIQIGDRIIADSRLCEVVDIGPPNASNHAAFNCNVISPLPSSGYNYGQNRLISRASATSPNVVIGTTTAIFAVPAVGSKVDVLINVPYTGMSGAIVWIGDDQYTIENVPPPPPSVILYLLNLTDAGAIAGLPKPILSVPELPAGRMGAYGLRHQTMCLTDGISFLYGDTVGGPSGTQANNYRDAVLKTTENDFLDSRGSFKLPTAGETIASMTFTAILDAAYGQGPLQIGTQSTIFTCAVPTNQADWAALENPIVTETLIGKGPQGQNSTLLANSDTLFRSTDGIGSLVYARREFITNWGNTPISSEVYRAIVQDNLALLNVGSAVSFDNRLLHTNKPTTTAFGICHQGALALNFDPVSSLKSKTESCWESLWTGTNTLQYITGTFSNTERCLLFAYDETLGAIQLWEQLRSQSSQYQDYGIGPSPIQWSFETAAIFKPNERDKSLPIVRLNNGRIHVANVIGDVHIKVQYRPDFWPCWIDWHEFDICSNVDAGNANSRPGYYDPIGLGQPSSASCEEGNNRPFRSGRFFQVRVNVTGKCTVMGLDFSAVPEPTIEFPAPKCEAHPCSDIVCSLQDDYAYNLNRAQ